MCVYYIYIFIYLFNLYNNFRENVVISDLEMRKSRHQESWKMFNITQVVAVPSMTPC